MFTKLAAVSCFALLMSTTAVRANTLHGNCSGAYTCSDNGTDTPVATTSPTFFFTSSPGNDVGDLSIVFLIPTNINGSALESITVVNTTAGNTMTTAFLYSTSPWSSGQLNNYLYVSASPTNPFGAFADPADPTRTGFDVYVADLGAQTLSGTAPLLKLKNDIPSGAYILAFIKHSEDSRESATANSGAILIDAPTGMAPTPEPSAIALLGTGALGLLGVLRRRIVQGS